MKFLFVLIFLIYYEADQPVNPLSPRFLEHRQQLEIEVCLSCHLEHKRQT